jgi:hypothetical protein
MIVTLQNREYRFAPYPMEKYVEATICFKCRNDEVLNNIIRDLESRSEENGLPVISPLLKASQPINPPETDWGKEKRLKLQIEADNAEIPSNSIDALEL